MKRNINRVSQIVSSFVDTGKFIQSCFDHESKPRSITAFIVSTDIEFLLPFFKCHHFQC